MALDHLPPAYRRAFKDKPEMADAWRWAHRKPQTLPLARIPAPPAQPIPLAETPAQIVLLDDAALSDWADSLTTRVGLQSELVWVGMNDGYTDAGGNDVAIPYLALYWLLGMTLKGQHCIDCTGIAMDSPYDPPGKGPNTISQAPGDGHTVCGARCHCWLEYGIPAQSTPQNYVWRNGVFPGPGQATRIDGGVDRPSPYGIDYNVGLDRQRNMTWGEAMVANPESEYFTAGQKGALDLFRAKWFAWEDARGALPQAPDMFARLDSAQDLDELAAQWGVMDANQRRILLDLQGAIGEWNAATAEANDALAAAEDAGQQFTEMGDENTIALFGGGFFGGFHGGGEEAGSARGHGSFGGGMIHTVNGERGVIRGKGGRFGGSEKGGWVHGGGGRRGFGGANEGEHGGGRRVSGEAERRAVRSPNEGANRRIMRGKIGEKVNDSERVSRLAITKRTGSAEKSPNEGAARRTNAVKTKATGGAKETAAQRNVKEIEGLHATSREWQASHAHEAEVRPGGKLTNLNHTGDHIDPLGHPNLATHVKVFGEHQVGSALYNSSMGALRETATDNGLATTGSRAQLVSRLTAAATHGHYSADFGHEASAAKSTTAKPAKAAKPKLTEDERMTAKYHQNVEKAQARLDAANAARTANRDPYAEHLSREVLQARKGLERAKAAPKTTAERDAQAHAKQQATQEKAQRTSERAAAKAAKAAKTEMTLQQHTEAVHKAGQRLSKAEAAYAKAKKGHEDDPYWQPNEGQALVRARRAYSKASEARQAALAKATPEQRAAEYRRAEELNNAAAKAAKPQKSAEEKLVTQRTTQLAKAQATSEHYFAVQARHTEGPMAAYRMTREEWNGPEGPYHEVIRAAELNLAHADMLANGETTWKGGEERPPFSKSEFLRTTLKPMNILQQGHNPGFTAKIGETTYHVKLVQRDTQLTGEGTLRYIHGSENAAYQAHAEQAATEIGHLLGVGEHMVDAHSFQVGGNHFVATKFQTGVKPLGDQDKGATPAKEAALFKSLGEVGAAKLTLHEYLTGNGDVHAGNILTSAKTGEVKLLDFGRAFTQPGPLMQGMKADSRPVTNSWFHAAAKSLGMKLGVRGLFRQPTEKPVYESMKFPKAAVDHAIAQEGKVIGILKAHGLDAAVKTTQARFNVLKQLGNDTSMQHFDELQTQAFMDAERSGTQFAEATDDTIQLWGFGGFRIGGGTRAGRGGGHSSEFESDHPRGIGGRWTKKGFHKNDGEHAGQRGHKSEEEHGGSHRTQEQERAKSPNEGAAKRMSRGEHKAAEREQAQHAAKQQAEHESARAAYKQTHDDSPLGVKMPFTREEFAAAIGSGQRLRGGNTADARLTTIAGERYVVKQVVGGGKGKRADETAIQSKYRQADQEVAGVEIAKLVGLGNSVGEHSLVIHHDMQTYSVQSFARGTTVGHLSPREMKAFDEANAGALGEKRMLFEYMVGRVDGHGGNYILNSATHEVKIIDFGNDFTTSTAFIPLQAMAGRAVLANHGGGSSTGDNLHMFLRPANMKQIHLDKGAIHEIVSHTDAVKSLVSKFHFNSESAMNKRLDVLHKLDQLENPTMHDLMLLSGMQEVGALGGGTRYKGGYL